MNQLEHHTHTTTFSGGRAIPYLGLSAAVGGRAGFSPLIVCLSVFRKTFQLCQGKFIRSHVRRSNDHIMWPFWLWLFWFVTILDFQCGRFSLTCGRLVCGRFGRNGNLS